MPAKPTDAEVEALREFNRVYARHLDTLSAGAASSALSVGEARVLREIAVRERTTAREVSQALSLDPGYLSRMLQDFQRRGLLWKETSPTDRRAQLISLTRAGTQAFARLDAYTREQAAHLLRDLPADERRRLVGAMRILSRWVSGAPEPRGGTSVRGHAPGDMGWVLERHGALFHREFGWDERFEALVALNVGRFLRERENERERCWIAERDGERVGCVLLVRDPDRFGVAKLQLLLVEPHARGHGVGSRLLNETTRFARKAGYSSIRLWTADVLEPARHLFEQAGYRMLTEAPFAGYGPPVRGQVWELEL